MAHLMEVNRVNCIQVITKHFFVWNVLLDSWLLKLVLDHCTKPMLNFYFKFLNCMVYAGRNEHIHIVSGV